MNNPVKQHTPPQNDKITLSEKAIAYAQQQLNKNPGKKGYRLSVKETGCSGLMYVVTLEDQSKADDITFEITSSLTLFVDKQSYPYLRGSHIDLKKQGLNHVFTYQNPNAQGECGCGESFTIKPEKKTGEPNEAP
jgi:iron-sulfur cluster assembly protein